MNEMEKNELIVKMVTTTAAVAGKIVDDWGMDIYVEAFLNFNDDQFQKAMVFMREAYRDQRLPKITEIERFATGKLPKDEEAVHVADLIAKAIVSYGLPNMEEAKAFMGELAWEVVQQTGGWATACALESNRDLQVAKSQWKLTAKSVQLRALGGSLHLTPTLNKPIGSERGLSPASKLIESMFDRRN